MTLIKVVTHTAKHSSHTKYQHTHTFFAAKKSLNTHTNKTLAGKNNLMQNTGRIPPLCLATWSTWFARNPARGPREGEEKISQA